MGNTLLLDTVTWDLVVDANGNIAVAKEPYSLAQDAASQCRLFQGELWYDTAQGIPYWQSPQTDIQSVLGKMPPLPLLKSYFADAAKSVPDVDSAQAFIATITRDRLVSGQVQITSVAGKKAAAFFAIVPQPITTVQPPAPQVLGEFVLGGDTLA